MGCGVSACSPPGRHGGGDAPGGIPLYGLESGDSIADFDLIGFSLGYEMAYTNVLNMLDLAGLPLRSGERTELSPIVVAGGTCAFNPEPLAPFVNLSVLGEGEDVRVEIIQLYRQAREEGWGKEEFLSPPQPGFLASMCPLFTR